MACSGNSATPNVNASGDLLLKVYRGDVLTGDYHTYVASTESGGETNQTFPAGLIDEPAWSPDRKWIAFSNVIKGSAAGSTSKVYIMPINIDQAIPVIEGTSPSWSSDGLKLAYTSTKDGEFVINEINAECIVLTITPCKPTEISLAKGSHPSWSPTSPEIVYENGNAVFILESGKGSVPTRLLSNDCFRPEPKWSPDGKKIAYSCKGAIYIMNRDGTGITKLVDGDNHNPQWSPDGQRIAFVAGNLTDKNLGQPIDSEKLLTTSAVFVINTDGSNFKRVTTRNDEAVLWQTWLPN